MSDPQSVRDRLLRVVWDDVRRITPDNVERAPAAARAIAAGAAPEDVCTAMNLASYETAFSLLSMLTGEHAEPGDYDQTVGWSLVEADLHDDGSDSPDASRPLDCVHEDLLTADPTGREGQDLFGVTPRRGTSMCYN